MPETTRQLAAIMFTDIVGYTALMGKNEKKALALLHKNREIQKHCIVKYNGRWLKEMGDGTLSSFKTITDAIHCAIEIQKDSKEEPQLKLRIGIHLGEVVFEGEDVFGDGVNIASRIEAIGQEGEIVVSEVVYQNIKNQEGIITQFIKEVQLKNLNDPIKIYRVGDETLASVKSRNSEDLDEYLNSIAVLPFTNMSNDPEQEYFCDGLSEDLLNLLAQIKGLKVAARTSAFYFKDKNVNITEIGNQLKVRTVLEGSVRKAGDKLRITVQLINCEDGYHLWSERYDRNMNDIFAIQDEIAIAITSKLKITLLEKDRALLTKRPTQNTDAYEKYLMGRFYLNKRMMNQGIDLLKQAISIAPDLAPAYAGMADTLVLSAAYSLLPSKEVMPQAKQFAEDALRIDPLLGEPCCSLGLYYASFEWNWAKAKDYFLKSIELNPSYIQSYLWYGHYYLAWVEGRFEEAKRYVQVAMELDPLNAIGYAQLAGILVTESKFEEALKVVKIGFELDPNSYAVQRVMGLVHTHLNQHLESIKCLEFASEISKRSSFSLVDIVFAYTANGTSFEKATKLVEELKDRIKDGTYISPWLMGVALGHIGNLDEAMNWFDAAYKDHDASLFVSKYYPWIPSSVRHDHRFQSLISKLKFPE